MQKIFKNIVVCLFFLYSFAACNFQNTLSTQPDRGVIPAAREEIKFVTSSQFKITYYWVFDPREEPVDMTTPFVELRNVKEQVIATVPYAAARKIVMEGSGFLPFDPLYVEPDNQAGAFLNVVNGKSWPGIRFMQVKNKAFSWGLSSRGGPLVPYWTVAVDPEVLPLGTIIYIPSFDGYVLPKGFTTRNGAAVHDGFFYCNDVSCVIKGSHIDIFTGTYKNACYTEKRVASRSLVQAGIPAFPVPCLQPDRPYTLPGIEPVFKYITQSGKEQADRLPAGIRRDMFIR